MSLFHRIATATLLATTLALPAQAHHGKPTLDPQREIEPFVREVVKEFGLDPDYVRSVLADAKPQGKIIDAMTRPAEGKPWHEYRPIFIKEKRIQSGVEFWREHAEALTRAQEDYGVPAEVIVAILGVETWYGRYLGKDRVIDSLATLGFRFPKRAKFFRSELRQFLALAKEESLDPFVVKGSYAGAMGWPQFISSSYRRFAVDFDNDGRRDLLDSPVDAIGSVANYLAEHGWQPGGPIAIPADVRGPAHVPLEGTDPRIRHSLKTIESKGVTLKRQVKGGRDNAGKAALINLAGKERDVHFVTFKNFYAITRYNHSSLYAMAVTQLAEMVAKRYRAGR